MGLFHPDSAVGAKKKGNVKSFRREIDGLVLLSRQRAVVLCERGQVDRDQVPQREKPL
jgi:hypothetical protein